MPGGQRSQPLPRPHPPPARSPDPLPGPLPPAPGALAVWARLGAVSMPAAPSIRPAALQSLQDDSVPRLDMARVLWGGMAAGAARRPVEEQAEEARPSTGVQGAGDLSSTVGAIAAAANGRRAWGFPLGNRASSLGAWPPRPPIPNPAPILPATIPDVNRHQRALAPSAQAALAPRLARAAARGRPPRGTIRCGCMVYQAAGEGLQASNELREPAAQVQVLALAERLSSTPARGSPESLLRLHWPSPLAPPPPRA